MTCVCVCVCVFVCVCVQRLRTERDSLNETIEELRCVKAQESQLTSGDCFKLHTVTHFYTEYVCF